MTGIYLAQYATAKRAAASVGAEWQACGEGAYVHDTHAVFAFGDWLD